MPGKQDPQAPIPRDALGRFPPGVSGNPDGTPKNKLRLTTILRRLLDASANPNDPQSVVTNADVLMASMLEYAKAGNSALCKEILDRIDGKLAERVEYAAGPSWEVVLDPPDDAKEGEE